MKARDTTAVHQALAALDVIPLWRHDLDHHEYALITSARTAGATWQEIAVRMGYKDRRGAQERHRALAQVLKQLGQP